MPVIGMRRCCSLGETTAGLSIFLSIAELPWSPRGDDGACHTSVFGLCIQNACLPQAVAPEDLGPPLYRRHLSILSMALILSCYLFEEEMQDLGRLPGATTSFSSVLRHSQGPTPTIVVIGASHGTGSGRLHNAFVLREPIPCALGNVPGYLMKYEQGSMRTGNTKHGSTKHDVGISDRVRQSRSPSTYVGS